MQGNYPNLKVNEGTYKQATKDCCILIVKVYFILQRILSSILGQNG